ncbi:MAG: AraC family transcriptional regulator [Bacteroidetes bacterium]|uniref:AraC family transcriptional regulator n=1 Tax=Candidatus Cryptobacteroides excrementipullorum TaxID=2840761 RepID=A0A9D9NLJ0_9BACT|nr:AraC family transcriptional regulator [Candidatus Cryptobacteroides excrementipullorum]
MERKKDGFADQKAIILPARIQESLAINELTGMLYVTDIGYYPKAAGHHRVRKDGSSQHILIFCTDGHGWCSIGGVRHEIRKNQCIIIEAEHPHSYGASDENPWSIYWLHFTGSTSRLFSRMYNMVIDIGISPGSRVKDRLLLFEEIYQSLQMGYSTDNLEYSSLCLWHFIASFKYTPQFDLISKVQNDDPVQESIAYMLKNIGKKLTLEEIAGHVRYSPSHFGHIFLTKTGYTPLCYFNQLKIQEACRLLDFTDMKIKEISASLGFYDQYHFSKVFLRHTGEMPTCYRKRNKG